MIATITYLLSKDAQRAHLLKTGEPASRRQTITIPITQEDIDLVPVDDGGSITVDLTVDKPKDHRIQALYHVLVYGIDTGVPKGAPRKFIRKLIQGELGHPEWRWSNWDGAPEALAYGRNPIADYREVERMALEREERIRQTILNNTKHNTLELENSRCNFFKDPRLRLRCSSTAKVGRGDYLFDYEKKGEPLELMPGYIEPTDDIAIDPKWFTEAKNRSALDAAITSAGSVIMEAEKDLQVASVELRYLTANISRYKIAITRGAKKRQKLIEQRENKQRKLLQSS